MQFGGLGFKPSMEKYIKNVTPGRFQHQKADSFIQEGTGDSLVLRFAWPLKEEKHLHVRQ
jgi:hypothetical protein